MIKMEEEKGQKKSVISMEGIGVEAWMFICFLSHTTT
jgi:hypothetical protein